MKSVEMTELLFFTLDRCPNVSRKVVVDVPRHEVQRQMISLTRAQQLWKNRRIRVRESRPAYLCIRVRLANGRDGMFVITCITLGREFVGTAALLANVRLIRDLPVIFQ